MVLAFRLIAFWRCFHWHKRRIWAPTGRLGKRVIGGSAKKAVCPCKRAGFAKRLFKNVVFGDFFWGGVGDVLRDNLELFGFLHQSYVFIHIYILL